MQLKEKYKVSSLLMKGVYGELYKVCVKDDDDTCEKYVLKVITRDGLSNDDTFTEQFNREIKLQQLASQNNISPKIIDYWINHTGGYIVMDRLYVPLKDVILLEGFTIHLAVYLVELILKLHEMDIQHGDTHIDNFMFDDKGNIYIIDFGNARIIKKDSLKRKIFMKRDFTKLRDSIIYLDNEQPIKNKDGLKYLNEIIKSMI